MIEALAHDLGKAPQATIGGRPKDLRLRIEMQGILEEGGMRSYEIWKRLKGRRWHKKFEFVDKVLKELWVVGILERNGERKYNLKKSLESKHSSKEASYKTFRKSFITNFSKKFDQKCCAMLRREVLEGEIG